MGLSTDDRRPISSKPILNPSWAKKGMPVDYACDQPGQVRDVGMDLVREIWSFKADETRNSKLAVLIVLFAITRFFLFHGAVSQVYRDKSGDVNLYANWASQIVDQNQAPYTGFNIEYPPVIPAFVSLPEMGREDPTPYYDRFVKLMVAVDILCFACVMLLAWRWKSLLGPITWIFGGFLLGPISYTRLDLLPALATLLAVVCISYGWWRAVGGWLAFGALAKVYPLFLMPIALAYCPGPRRKHFVIGAAVVTALILMPYFGSLDDLSRNVVSYHADRGIEIGSTWAGFILIAGRSGYDFATLFSFGSVNVYSGISPLLKTVSLTLSVLVLLGGSVLAFFEARRNSSRHRIPVSMLAMLLLLMFTGTVLSPQFIIWPIALAAAALCHPQEKHITWTMLLLIPMAGLTYLIFRYAAVEEPPGLLYLNLRNLTFLFMGAELFIALWSTNRPTREEAVLPAEPAEASAG